MHRLHEILIHYIPAETHRPERRIAILRLICDKIGSICPERSRKRIFIIQRISQIGKSREIALHIIAEHGSDRNTDLRVLSLGIICHKTIKYHHFLNRIRSQVIIIVSINRGKRTIVQLLLTNFNTPHEVKSMAFRKGTVKIQLVTPVISICHIFTFIQNTSFANMSFGCSIFPIQCSKPIHDITHIISFIRIKLTGIFYNVF